MWWLYPAFAIGAYLIGSIPVGLIIGQRARGVDVREFGSGKTGFTNSLRALGLGPSLLVFLGDFLKGAVPVALAHALSPNASLQVVAAVGAVAGHDWPVYAGFRGGRGVTTSLGATAVMMPPIGLLIVVIATALLYVYRYVSLASIVATPTAAVVVWLLIVLRNAPLAYGVWGTIATVLILVLHRDNIARLRDGTEPKIGQGGQRRTRPGQANT